MPAALHAQARVPPPHGLPRVRLPRRAPARALGGGRRLRRGAPRGPREAFLDVFSVLEGVLASVSVFKCVLGIRSVLKGLIASAMVFECVLGIRSVFEGVLASVTALARVF